jgi:putative alpha-1,2-mannosidase
LDSLYGIGPEKLALSGMDDAGEMSSWYVFAAMGVYPLSPADTEYIVSVPLFKTVNWTLPDGKKVTIRHQGESRQLKQVNWKDKTLNDYFVPHTLFQEGGELIIQTK